MNIVAPALTTVSALVSCAHCGSRVAEPRIRPADHSFCCDGCETVYSILHARGLSEYYSLKRTGAWLRSPLPAAELDQTYAYLDDPAFQKNYVTETADGGWQMTFYAEGIHCVACVWLLEKLPEFVPGIRSVTLDMSSSTALVRVPAGGSFAEAAREFHGLGYKPHPVRGAEHEEHQKRENRLMLIRVGVAGACHGNIMLLAFSLYGGAGGELGRVFAWVSFLLFLPVAFFSATPFYKDAWAALRLRRVSIDVPIVLGVVTGSIASFVNLVRGSSHIYFDSLSSLVFLLLASRYVLKRAQQNALQSSKLLHFLMPSAVRKKTGEAVEETSIDLIQPGDVVQVRANEPIPIDGTVVRGRSTLNCALLTGESDPVDVSEGRVVYAGTVNQSSILEIRASASGYATRLGQILKAIEEGVHRKAPIVTLTDAVSRHFVAAVLVLAAVALGWGAWATGWEEGFHRMLALLIITCPCALALATPLALSVSIGKAARAGILIKGADVLERLARVKAVFLDKTGTLTSGDFEVLDWSVRPGFEAEAREAALALESRSNHPIAKALVRYLSPRGAEAARAAPAGSEEVVADFREVAGKGVSGLIRGVRYELGQAPSGGSGTRVALTREGEQIAQAALGDRLREDSHLAIESLRARGLDLYIVSGDAEEPVAHVAAKLGIPGDRTTARASPERKNEIIRSHDSALMVGDGANDAIALSSAYVGVAVHGGMEVSLRAADAYLSRPGVASILNLLTVSSETMKVLRRNLVFSLVYNVAGGTAALFGFVNPLFAAILMPMSALTVFLSSISGTRALRQSTRAAR